MKPTMRLDDLPQINEWRDGIFYVLRRAENDVWLIDHRTSLGDDLEEAFRRSWRLAKTRQAVYKDTIVVQRRGEELHVWLTEDATTFERISLGSAMPVEVTQTPARLKTKPNRALAERLYVARVGNSTDPKAEAKKAWELAAVFEEEAPDE